MLLLRNNAANHIPKPGVEPGLDPLVTARDKVASVEGLDVVDQLVAGVNKKPKKFKIIWHGFWIILKLSGRVNQVRIKLSAGFGNTVCWTSKTCLLDLTASLKN